MFATLSDKLQKRSPFIFVGQLVTVIGLAILLSDAPSGVRYFGTFFCIAGPYAGFPGVLAWCVSIFERQRTYSLVCRLSNNMAGQYKRGTGLAFQIGFGNFAGGAYFFALLPHSPPMRLILRSNWTCHLPPARRTSLLAWKWVSPQCNPPNTCSQQTQMQLSWDLSESA